jgi:hypothetical protein
MTAREQLPLFGTVPVPWDIGCECRDCGLDTIEADEFYLVRDGLWPKEPDAGIALVGCLCIGCLETRLGRRLEPGDFRPNAWYARLPHSRRLAHRQGGAA